MNSIPRLYIHFKVLINQGEKSIPNSIYIFSQARPLAKYALKLTVSLYFKKEILDALIAKDTSGVSLFIQEIIEVKTLTKYY